MSQHRDWHSNLVQYERGDGVDFASERGLSTEHEDELQREALEWKGNKSHGVTVCPVKNKLRSYTEHQNRYCY